MDTYERPELDALRDQERYEERETEHYEHPKD